MNIKNILPSIIKRIEEETITRSFIDFLVYNVCEKENELSDNCHLGNFYFQNKDVVIRLEHESVLNNGKIIDFFTINICEKSKFSHFYNVGFYGKDGKRYTKLF